MRDNHVRRETFYPEGTGHDYSAHESGRIFLHYSLYVKSERILFCFAYQNKKPVEMVTSERFLQCLWKSM